MPTYQYECDACGSRFEKRQSMTDPAVCRCPECGAQVRRLISGGTGFILKNVGRSPAERQAGGCSLEQRGKTCCGREQRCEKPSCNSRP